MSKRHYQNTHKLELIKRGSYSSLITPQVLVLNRKNEIMLLLGGEKETPVKNLMDYLQESKMGSVRPTTREHGDVISLRVSAAETRNHYVFETEKRDEVFMLLAYANQLKPNIKSLMAYNEQVDAVVAGALQRNEPPVIPAKPASLHDLVLAWDGDLQEAIYRTLYESYNTPFIKEWMPYISSKLSEQGLLEELNVYTFGEHETPLKAALIKTSIHTLRSIISEGIQSMDLEFFVYESLDEEEDKLSSIREVGEYISAFGPELAKLIQESIKVDFDPATDRHHPVLIDMNLHANNRGITGYYPPQANTMMGIARTLKRDSFAFLIGEMG